MTDVWYMMTSPLRNPVRIFILKMHDSKWKKKVYISYSWVVENGQLALISVLKCAILRQGMVPDDIKEENYTYAF